MYIPHFAVRHIFIPQRKKRFRNGAQRILISLFLAETLIPYLHFPSQKPEPPFSFLTPSCVPYSGLFLFDLCRIISRTDDPLKPLLPPMFVSSQTLSFLNPFALRLCVRYIFYRGKEGFAMGRKGRSLSLQTYLITGAHGQRNLSVFVFS
jgi:hypothetical protein